MKKLITCGFVIALTVPWSAGCSSSADQESADRAGDSGDADSEEPDGPRRDDGAGSADGSVSKDGSAGDSEGSSRPGSGRDASARSDAGASTVRDGGAANGAARDGASGEPAQDGGPSNSGADRDGSVDAPTCALPTTFKWTGGAPLTQPKNGAVSMKDVSYVFHNGQHILYYTTFQSSWGSGMMTFKDWPDAASAPQNKTTFGVAPTLFYFTPKQLWVLAYQWGPHKFSYRTATDPTNPGGWSAEKSLYNTALPPDGTGPIDQTVICDSVKCYLFYAGDNGHIYVSSMAIGSFPGEFGAAKDSGIVGTAQNLFEAVQVYKLKGSDKYLMIVEAQGGARYFRAWTATSLEGPWALLTNDFAVKKNVTLSSDWTNDISHGDLVRKNPDETFTIDPCDLQFVFQGRDPKINTDYGNLPYRLGLLTLQR